MGTTRLLVCAVVLGAGLIGCSNDDSSDSSPEITSGSTTESAPTSVDAANTTVSPSMTPPPSSSAGTSTPSQPGAPTTAVMSADGFEPPPADRITVSVDVPTGEFVAAPGDLVVVRTNGDLEYRPNALSPGNEAPPILLVGLADPFSNPREGPGPNLVSDVAAFVDGSVLYGKCCEPVFGNVFAIDAPRSAAGPIAAGDRVEHRDRRGRTWADLGRWRNSVPPRVWPLRRTTDRQRDPLGVVRRVELRTPTLR